jgi:hypothetical protein
MNESLKQIDGKSQGKRKELGRKSCPSVTLFTTNPT